MMALRDFVSLGNIYQREATTQLLLPFDLEIPKHSVLYEKQTSVEGVRCLNSNSSCSNCSVSTKDGTSTNPGSQRVDDYGISAATLPLGGSLSPLADMQLAVDQPPSLNYVSYNNYFCNNNATVGSCFYNGMVSAPDSNCDIGTTNIALPLSSEESLVLRQQQRTCDLTQQGFTVKQDDVTPLSKPLALKDIEQLQQQQLSKMNAVDLSDTKSASTSSPQMRYDGWHPALIDLFSDKKSNKLLSPNFKLEFGSNEFFKYLLQLPSIDLAYLARITARYRRRSRVDNNKSTIVSVNICGCDTPHTTPVSKLDTYEKFYVHYKNRGVPQNVCDAARSVILVELHTDLDVAEFLERRLPVMVRRQVGNKLNENFVVQIFNITFLKEHLAGCWSISDLPECTSLDMERLQLHPLYQHMLSEVHRRQNIPVFRNLNLCALKKPA